MPGSYSPFARRAYALPPARGYKPPTPSKGGGWWIPGSQLDLDFANNRAFNRSTGFNGSPNGILTYTSPSPKLVYGDDGVLGYAPHNLLKYSEQFDNAAWVKVSGITVTANQIPGPTGETTADLVLKNATGFQAVRQSVTLASNSTVTQRVWARSGNTDYIAFTDGASCVLTVSLIDGSVTRNTGALGNVSVTLEGGFYRISYTQVLTAGAQNILYMWPTDVANSGGFVTISTTASMYIWGAQLNLGSSALTYIPTTSTARYSLPIDHNPTTFAPLGVLIEEQRTNLLTYAEQFDNAAWTKYASSVSANAVSAPDGTLTADRLLEAATTASHLIVPTSPSNVVSGTVYAGSVFLKKGTGATAPDWVQLTFQSGGFGSGQYANFNLNTGAIGAFAGTGVSSKIEDVGDGWYRCCIIGPATASTTAGLAVVLTNNADSGRIPAYAGAVTSDIYIWGAQLEAGAFATSYIQTGSAQVTRASDKIDLLTSAFNFSDSAGTILTESDVDATSGVHHVFSLHDGSNNERSVLRSIDAAMNYVISDGGVSQASNNVPGTVQARQVNSVAFAFAVNDIALSMDGGSITSDTSATLPTVTTLSLGAAYYTGLDQLNGHIKRIVVWNTRKPNAELQALSA